VLTADLVSARRRGKELVLTKLDPAARARAAEVAAQLLRLFQSHLGRSREEVEAGVAAVDVLPRETRVKEGLFKLIDDRATWGVPGGLDPAEVRRAVFLRATAVRAALLPGQRFERDAVLGAVATARTAEPSAIEQALFADLRGAALLAGLEPISAPALVELYERGQAQAVLLRAVRISVAVECASPAVARALFRRLKFLGLLHTIAPAEKGYTIIIDGPLSLFDAVTKYGQKMALVLPVLEGCQRWTLEADIRWGKARAPLTFRASGGTGDGVARDAPRDPPLPEAIAELVHRFAELGTGWTARPNERVLDLAGVGLCIPDLVFARGGEKIFFEALGFWSREAVFRRVDLVERGLEHKLLFAVSSRLRVSEEVMGEDTSSALYVYKGAMNARAIAEKLDRLAARAAS
jgi:predicted nuclease of restriction endonuclease-like RecB superfamily